MDSAGGVMSAAMAARRPVRTLESGGAAGVTAAGLVERLIGAPAVISFDMGGTTAKVGIVRDGKPAVTNDFQVGGKGSFGGTRAGTGFPVKIPTVDLAEVGAGGGSIAWVDPGGALRVGPQSAGSMPGPACYGRGGTEPTVTDANLLLGYLDPAGLAGGVTLSVEAATDAIARAVARAARHRRHRRGARHPRHREREHGRGDPRRHRAARHRPARLHPRRVRRRGPDARGAARRRCSGSARSQCRSPPVSRQPSVSSVPTSAWSSCRRASSISRVRMPGRSRAAFAELTAQARAELAEEPGATFVVTRSADVRYRGQAYHLTVPVPDHTLARRRRRATRRATSATLYHDTYGISLEHPTQVHNLRVHVTRVVDKLTPRARPVEVGNASAARTGERMVVFPSAGPDPITTSLYDRARLVPGDQLAGPAVIAAPESTIVVPPDTHVEIDTYGTILLTLK